MRNIKPLTRSSFKIFLQKRKLVFIVLVAMGFGVLLIGQTVPQNFFKKLFSPEKVSVAKDSVGTKQKSPRRTIIKKPVVVNEEKVLAPGITCPTPNPKTVCLTSGTTHTQFGTGWDAITTPDLSCTNPNPITIAYSAPGILPNTGTSLNNAVFPIGTSTVTWTATDGCGATNTCSFNVIVYGVPASPLNAGTFTVTDITACSNYNPPALNLTGTSGGTGAYSYQWQVSTNGGTTWSNVGTGISYDPPNIIVACYCT